MRLKLLIVIFAVSLLGSPKVEAGWKKKCAIAVAGLAIGVTASVGVFSATQAISNAQHADLPLDQSVIHVDGASISAGTGASLPLQMRLRDQLQRQNIDLQDFYAGQSMVFLLDYFYPSNFTNLSHEDSAFVEAEVRRIVAERLSTFDFVVLGLLPESSGLDAQRLESVSEDHPVRFVLSFLESNPRTKDNVRIVNQTLRALKVEFPDQILLADPTSFSQKLLGMSEVDALALMPDRIHPNDDGQALFINEMILPTLAAMPGFDQMNPVEQISAYQNALATANQIPGLRALVTAHFAEQAVRAQSLGPYEFSLRSPGLYWISIEQTGGKNPLGSKTSLHQSGLVDSRYLSDVPELLRIQSGIATLSPFMPSGFTLSFIERDGERSAVLNLAQALFYTSIELRETAHDSGVFEAWGYDFWSSQLENENDPIEKSPRTNYFFRLKLDPYARTNAHLSWWVLPMLRDENAQLAQATPLLRLGYVAADTEAALEESAESMPRLVYEIPLRVR